MSITTPLSVYGLSWAKSKKEHKKGDQRIETKSQKRKNIRGKEEEKVDERRKRHGYSVRKLS